jgi:hypothetical protein
MIAGVIARVCYDDGLLSRLSPRRDDPRWNRPGGEMPSESGERRLADD